MYDIIFIGNDGPQWNKLKSKFITAKRATTFEEAYKKAFTKLFWIVWPDVDVVDDFNFDYVADDYSQDIVHVFKNGNEYDGIALIPKSFSPGKQELKFRFFTRRKEVDIIASYPKSKVYDIVFISYNEPNADANYKALQQRFPRAKRVHGVKGIHQAHIAAAKLCDTDMFWIVDGDAMIVDDFNFDYQVPTWDYRTIHVWRSINPINKLIYGYGGIKLFPRQMTIDMDTSKPDMTTSISNKFKAVPEISNITAFNTDPFNTWKSAFRECAKLSSKIIDRQVDTETEERLAIWCSNKYKDRDFGSYAVDGAKAGRSYGVKNSKDTEALKLINDFDWLQDKFDEQYS